jgi:putative transposase
MADNGVACSMSRFGDVWDNAAPKNVFSQPETERITGEVHRTRHEARADVLDRSERVYNVVSTRSAIGDASPVEFARKMGLASPRVHETRRRP